MRREATFVLVVSILAGCLAPEEAAPAAVVDAPVTEPGLSDRVELDGSAGPGGRVTAAWWTVPEGAMYKDAFFETTDVTVLEAAILPDGSAGLAEWALLLFAESDGELALISQHVYAPGEVELFGPLAGEPAEPDPTPRPFHVRLAGLEAGTRIAIVLAAAAPQEIPVRLIFRALDHDPGFERPPPDAGAMIASPERAPIPLARSANATGLQVAAYTELNFVSFVVMGVVERTPAATVDGGVSPDARPFGGHRDMTISAASPGRGWSSALGFYLATDAVGEWSASLDARGATAEGGGRIVQPGTLPVVPLVTLLAFGIPAFSAQGEGDEPSTSAFRITATEANPGGAQALVFLQLDLGATLQELTGVPGPSEAFVLEPLVPLALRVHEGDLHIGHGGATTTIVGAAPLSVEQTFIAGEP